MTAWCHLPTIFNRRHALRSAGLLALCAAFITTLLFAHVAHAVPNVTKTVTFQGRLLTSSGAVVPDGHYNLQFKIYEGGSGTAAGNPDGTLKWTETYINNGDTDGVEVNNGFFSVALGSLNQFGTSVDWEQELWLSMNVAGSSTSCTTFDTAPCIADGEMLPMRKITATPYAINSGAVGGKTVDQLIQNTTTPQTNSNIALQSASDSDVTALIQGRESQTATNLVIKQGASQTGKALDVQASNGDSYFNISATGTLNQTGDAAFGGNLGVGTADPGRPLDVAVSSSSTNALPVRITQQGTGDTGIELAATGSSKYSIGIDASDGSFKVASSIAGGATNDLGDNTTGTTNYPDNYQHVQAQKVTATESGTVIDMSVYLVGVDSFCPNIQLGVYADNGSGTSATTLLGTSSPTAGTVGWNKISLNSSVNITSGTVYWLGVATECDDTMRYTPGVGNRIHMTGISGLPSTFSTEISGSGQLALYATIDTSAGVTDSFGGSATIFDLGPTGNATFKNSVDSDSAFQVKDSGGSDVLSVNTDDSAGAQNIQVGTGSGSGTPTLLTLDKGGSAPSVDSSMLGSMYYDTTLGKVQCYEAEGWGNCGDSPDTFVTISPEYTNAVMNGTDIGTITSDLCSDTLNINDGSSAQPTICGTNETYNFYKWTSAESTDQTRSIFVTYQLPTSFKEFVAGSTSLKARTDNAASGVTYQVYRDSSSGLASCGSAISASTGTQSTWQEGIASGSADPANCSFNAGDSIFFRINLTAKDNANAYVSNLAFTFSNN